MEFPLSRMRRLRANPTIRRMVRETRLTPDHLIYPLFVIHGEGLERPIASMPGVFQYSIDRMIEEARAAHADGIPAVILFGLPAQKDAAGTEAYAEDGIIQRAVTALKNEIPTLLVITDVCLCEYTDHGHCGLLDGEKIDNDTTLPLLAREAVSHALAGADMVAPSDMMDGRVAAIRHALDGKGFADTPILSYAAKFSSAFYGPFRNAADSAPQFGDRKSYQMDPANRRQALREVELDIVEGADLIMVKPALSYLDVIREVRNSFDLPVVAYNVSGEYSMVHAAAERGWVDGEALALEILLSIRRAGADLIITYHAREACRWFA